MTLFAMLRNIFHEYRGVVRNFMALSFLQATNLLVPLLLIPLLIKRIGMPQYGVVALAQSTMMYFYVWVDYGFSLSAVKRLHEKNQNKEDLSQLFYEVSITKLGLLFVGYLVLWLVISVYPTMYQHKGLFLGSYLLVAGQAILPVWFFQGVEQMSWATYANFVSKTLSALLIYAFVHNPSDGIWVNILFGGSTILVGVVSIAYLIRKYSLNFKLAWLEGIPKLIYQGFFYFTTHFSVSLYMHSGILVLGWFVDEQMLGIYSVAEKVALLLRQVLVMFSQAIYTQLCNILIQGYAAMQSFLRKLFLPFCVVIGMGSTACWFFAPLISEVIHLTSQEKIVFIRLVKYLAFIPIIVGINIPFYQLLIISDNGKSATKLVLAGAFLCVTLNVLLIPSLSVVGPALALLFTESTITIFVILKAKNRFSSLFS